MRRREGEWVEERFCIDKFYSITGKFASQDGFYWLGLSWAEIEYVTNQGFDDMVVKSFSSHSFICSFIPSFLPAPATTPALGYTRASPWPSDAEHHLNTWFWRPMFILGVYMPFRVERTGVAGTCDLPLLLSDGTFSCMSVKWIPCR